MMWNVFLLAALVQGASVPPVVDEIDRISAAEPPVLGIDTQIRAARAMGGAYPEEAARWLRSAASRIAALGDVPTRLTLAREWLPVQAALDADEAEPFLAALLDSLPGRGMGEAERAALLNLAETAKEKFPALAERARRRGEAIPQAAAKPKSEDKPGLFSVTRLIGADRDPADVLAEARREKDPTAALDRFLHVMDLETDPRRRTAILEEALNLTPRVADLVDRLLAQSMLTRRLYEAGDRPRAAVGAQMLEETFEKFFRCDLAVCDRIIDDGNPGEAIAEFAEYLREHGIRAEELGLSHPSLRVRLLILGSGAKDGLGAGGGGAQGGEVRR